MSLKEVVFPAPLTPSRPKTIPCPIANSYYRKILQTEIKALQRRELPHLICGPCDASHSMGDLRKTLDGQAAAAGCGLHIKLVMDQWLCAEYGGAPSIPGDPGTTTRLRAQKRPIGFAKAIDIHNLQGQRKSAEVSPGVLRPCTHYAHKNARTLPACVDPQKRPAPFRLERLHPPRCYHAATVASLLSSFPWRLLRHPRGAGLQSQHLRRDGRLHCELPCYARTLRKVLNEHPICQSRGRTGSVISFEPHLPPQPNKRQHA